MQIIFNKLYLIWHYLFEKGGLIFSFLLTSFLAAIGFPKQVIIFIIVLVILDILSRWVAEVIKAYGKFDFLLFLKAWKHKKLNSKKLKRGLFLKVFFYSILLYIAHQCSICNELIFNNLISNFLYSILIVLDCISICENATDAGFDNINPIHKYLIKKKDDLLKK